MPFSRKSYNNKSIDDYYETFVEIRKNFKHALGNEVGLFDVAVSEAIINGIKYSDPALLEIHGINIHIYLFKNKVVARVDDPGKGFAGNQYVQLLKKEKDMILSELLMNESGRGILIMLEASDCLIYNKVGNEVILMKRKKRNPNI